MNIKFFFIIPFALLLLSCTQSPEELLKKGKTEEALKKYIEQLSEQYYTTESNEIRNKISSVYFKMTKDFMKEGDLQAALKNLERSQIYASEKDKNYKKKYADILCTIGEHYLKTGSDSPIEGVNKNRLYNKGLALVNKSVEIAGAKSKGNKILNDLRLKKAEESYNDGIAAFNRFLENRSRSELIIEAKHKFNQAKKLNSTRKSIDKYLDDIKEKTLSIALKDREYSLKLEDPVFYNNSTGKLALKFRFYNYKKNGFRAVAPSQFTLYDTKGNIYKPLENNEELTGYKGVLIRRRLDAQRSIKGLLVFKVGRYKRKFDKLVWVSSMGETEIKYFPDKDIRKIKLN